MGIGWDRNGNATGTAMGTGCHEDRPRIPNPTSNPKHTSNPKFTFQNPNPPPSSPKLLPSHPLPLPLPSTSRFSLYCPQLPGLSCLKTQMWKTLPTSSCFLGPFGAHFPPPFNFLFIMKCIRLTPLRNYFLWSDVFLYKSSPVFLPPPAPPPSPSFMVSTTLA